MTGKRKYKGTEVKIIWWEMVKLIRKIDLL